MAGVGRTKKRDMEWNRMAPRGQGAVAAPIFTGFKTSGATAKGGTPSLYNNESLLATNGNHPKKNLC